MKKFTRIMVAAILLMFLVTMASAQGLPKAETPEAVGFSSERLKKISAALQADVDKGVIPGAVVTIVRKGRIAYYEPIGYQAREKKIQITGTGHRDAASKAESEGNQVDDGHKHRRNEITKPKEAPFIEQHLSKEDRIPFHRLSHSIRSPVSFTNTSSRFGSPIFIA